MRECERISLFKRQKSWDVIRSHWTSFWWRDRDDPDGNVIQWKKLRQWCQTSQNCQPEFWGNGTDPGPLYLVGKDIKAWRDYITIPTVYQCACRFTENCTSCGGAKGSKREEMKDLVTNCKKWIYWQQFFNSVSNVNLKTIIGYKRWSVPYGFPGWLWCRLKRIFLPYK